ncbi:MAG: methyltransferase domain-containing protein, partial [Actinobacteria bacterium]|nr:methyltransferase domain-containing protein [Actinomycetota bacterium]
MNIDTGKYNKDSAEYRKLVEELYFKYKDGVNLPPEYSYFVQEDLHRLLIRLARYKFVARIIKNTDYLLEVGCGSGLGSIFLSQHCAYVTGIDIKTTEIKEAMVLNKRENVSFKTEDFFNISDEELYDGVVALDVIEHLSEKQGLLFIEKAAKHIKSNGMFIIGTPSIYSHPYQSKLSKASHVKCYDLKELEILIENNFCRTISFSMNDELVHTGNHKMAWY